MSRHGIRKDIFENFYFMANLLQKSELENRSNRYLTQSRLQVMGCTAERYCLLHVVVQGSGSFRDRSTFLYDVRLRSYGASKLPNFRILAYFPHTKSLKCTFSLQPRMIAVFPCGSRRSKRRSKEVPSGTGDFLRLLVGQLGSPKLAQIFAYRKWLYPYIMLLHGASALDQRCLKTRNSEDECTFPPNIFAPTPKITPKPHFGGPFIQTYYTESPPSVAR